MIKGITVTSRKPEVSERYVYSQLRLDGKYLVRDASTTDDQYFMSDDTDGMLASINTRLCAFKEAGYNNYVEIQFISDDPVVLEFGVEGLLQVASIDGLNINTRRME